MADTQQEFEGDWSKWEGLGDPHTTQFPDVLIDKVMAHVTPAEWKVICYIVRRTWGFKKSDDAISLKQMVEGITKKDGERLDFGTGLSRQGVINAIKSLVEKGIVVVAQAQTDDGDSAVNVYAFRKSKKGT